MKVLAAFTTSSHDGEAWTSTMIFPKHLDPTEKDRLADRPVGKRVTKADALEASGMEQRSDDRMGHGQLSEPTVTSAFGIWIVQQSGYANV